MLTVRIVDPEDDADAGGGAVSQQELEDALQKLEHMFAGELEDPIMKAIFVSARSMLEHALPGR